MTTTSVDTGESPRPDARAEPHSVAVVAATVGAPGRAEPTPSASGFTPGTIGASIAVLVVFLAVWEWLPRAGGVPEFILPPPSKVWSEFLRMLANERLLWHTGITTLEIIVGFVLGCLLGIAIGFVLGLSPKTELVLSPYILALQIAPKVAFAPLFVMWLGYTVYPKILVAILIVFFPVMVNVLTAVRTVDPDMVSLARSFSATRLQIFRLIEYPASLPPLFAGLRIAATLAVIGVVVGELVGGNLGLGYLLTYGEGQGNTAMVFVTIIVLTLIGIIAYAAVTLMERRVLHYMPKAQHATV
jgi:NitT/TauT family transport system permease protein